MFKIFGRSRRASTEATSKNEAICTDTGLPYGELGSTEGLGWIFAMDDPEDAEERV